MVHVLGMNFNRKFRGFSDIFSALLHFDLVFCAKKEEIHQSKLFHEVTDDKPLPKSISKYGLEFDQ